MIRQVIKQKQNLTYLDWSHARSSSGTAGTFLKSESAMNGQKIYYKLSHYDSEKGIIGHESIYEIIVDRLLDILGVEHLNYQLIHADVEVDGKVYETWVCASKDFKVKGETKIALDTYYQIMGRSDISKYDFCRGMGWQKYIDTMLAVDYLILNRDRHGANIEVLQNNRKHTRRIAPLFDHGVSLLFSAHSDEEIRAFNVMEDRVCNNYFGSKSTLENLNLIQDKKAIFLNGLQESDKEILFCDLEDALSSEHREKLWEMIYRRWCYYESLCNM
ncbi:MAG: hypothetical protein IJ336_07560 [Lachnospiraceae bacterium]|nr:hypothetical protein [Lachnospiraceae bacterium]